MNLNDFFPHQVCINLDKRPDRWERIRARFVEHRINRIARFPAIDGENLDIPSVWPASAGAYGCLRSHLAVVEQARDETRPSVLIFEDDAVLAPGFSPKFADYVKQLPGDWDMVFFGGLHGEPLTKVADNVMKITHSLSTYAYALKHTIYDDFIELNRRPLSVLDENTRALQKRFNCYCFMPHLAWVEEDYSDVRDEMIDLWWLRESLVLFGPEIDAILANTAAVISYCNENPGSLRNLNFTIEHFSLKLPTVALLVLERGRESTVHPSQLPHNCTLEFVEDSGCRNRRRAVEKGFEILGLSKDFFIFLDSDVFLTREDLRANLLKCRDYDFASSFREIYDLDDRDTLRILSGDLRWHYDNPYRSRKKATIWDSCCIATREGVRILTGQENIGDQGEVQLSKRPEELRVYDSTNRARRLSPG